MFDRTIKAVAFVAVLAGSVATLATVASSASTAGPEQTAYVPMQGITEDLGSKAAIGYFIREAGACQVVLMISEKVDPETGAVPSAARLRLALMPGQSAGLDSEEGRSIDLTCGEDAGSLSVRASSNADSTTLTN